MTLPTIRQEGDSLVFEWDIGPARVQAEVEEVHHESSGWHAEIQWLNLSDEVRPLISAWKHINLSSPTTVKSHAKSLQEITGFDASWDQMIEQIAARGIADKKKGSPFTKIGGVGEILPKVYRMEKFLEEKQLTWLYGPGESCKTLVADAIALTVQEMAIILGLTAEQGETLVLDWETDEEEHTSRLRRIANGAGLYECPEVHYRHMAAPLAREAREIKRYIVANKIELVIIDSVGWAMGESTPGGSPLMPMVAAIRDWNVTALCIDHVSHEALRSSDVRMPYGDIYKVNAARSAFEVRSSPDSTKDRIDLAIYHRKSNNGKRWPMMGYAVTFTPNTITFKRADVMDDPDLAAGTTHADRIEAVLKHGQMTAGAISEATGIREATVRTTLLRGQGARRFAKTPQGFYYLPARDEQDVI